MNIVVPSHSGSPRAGQYTVILVTDHDVFAFEHSGVQYSSPYPVLWYGDEGVLTDGSVVDFTYRELNDALNSLQQYRTGVKRLRSATNECPELLELRSSSSIISVLRCNTPTLVFATSGKPAVTVDMVMYNGIIGTPSVDPTHLLSSIVKSYGYITHFAIV